MPYDRSLRVFHEICRAPTLSAASLKLHRSQPTISYQLRQLERSLGVELFERRGRSLALTDAGRRLQDFCKRYFAEYARLCEELTLSPLPLKPLRIASVSVFGRYVLAPRLRRSKYDHVALDLAFPVATEVFTRVLAGTVDLGFTHYRATAKGLVHLPVKEEEYVLIKPASWSVRHDHTLTEQPFVTYDESEPLIARWFAVTLSLPSPRYRSIAHFEEVEEAIAWVAAGRGVTVVPRCCVAVAGGRDVSVLRTRRKCPNTVYAVLAAERRLNPEASAVLKDFGLDPPARIQ